MPRMPVLDIAVGLSLTYLIFSLLVTALNELVESALKARAANLLRGIREMFEDDAPDGVTAKLYNHPLIRSLFRSPAHARQGAATFTLDQVSRRKLPSYIPSRNFALAVMGILVPSGQSGSLADYRAAALQLPNRQVGQALAALFDAADGDIAKARQNIEGWYDSAMDRAAGWYKRHAQTVCLSVGLAVAIIANVDTLVLVRTLSTNEQLRERLVETASAYIDKTGSLVPQAPAGADAGEAPAGDATASPASSASPTASAAPASAADAERAAENALRELKALSLPIGWADPRNFPGDQTGSQRATEWLLKLVGWLLTAVAATLGAPFWFDLLNKFMIVRATVKPKEKSPDEPPLR